MKGRLFVFHWNAAEARELCRPLAAAGWDVRSESEDGARGGRQVVSDPPDAVVVYLTRLPSHGRETAHGIRAYKATRETPIIFVDGAGEALAKTKAKIPDAIYTTSGRLKTVLARIGKRQPSKGTQRKPARRLTVATSRARAR